jgi:hypothetical protein
MNQILRDKAWKVFEITFCIALIWLVVIDWKSFLAWLFDSWVIFAAAVIPLLLLAIVLLAIERND